MAGQEGGLDEGRLHLGTQQAVHKARHVGAFAVAQDSVARLDAARLAGLQEHAAGVGRVGPDPSWSKRG